MKATFKGARELTDLDPPNGYTIGGEGQGGVAGFAKGGAKVRLDDVEGGTTLIYDVEAQVGGKIAQLGGRLINGVAKKYADEFFANFAKSLVSGRKRRLRARFYESPVPESWPLDRSISGGSHSISTGRASSAVQREQLPGRRDRRTAPRQPALGGGTTHGHRLHDGERAIRHRRRRSAHAARAVPARESAAHRHPCRLRHQPVRRLRRSSQRARP